MGATILYALSHDLYVLLRNKASPFGVETGEPVRFSGSGHPAASDLTMAEARCSRINALGIEYEGKTGLSTSEFSWAA